MTEQTISGIKPGLRVVITAGASGIGRVIAETLRAHGARIHVCDVSQEALDACRKALPDVGTTLADVADVKQVDRFFDTALSALGGLDVLVNNAGIAGPTAGVEDIDPAEWDRTVAINLNGQFYSARKAVPALRKTEDGAIINMSSVAGRFGYAYRTPYAATKWAIVGFTQSLAKELGPAGIHVVHFVIDGAVVPDSGAGHSFTAGSIAKSYMAALAQPPGAWSWEIELRSHVEPF